MAIKQTSHADYFGAAEAPPLAVRKIGYHDLATSLRQGFDDFAAMPSHLVFAAALYPLIGLILGRLTYGGALLPLAFPLFAGFALVGPLAALGLYELSRRREQRLPVTWSAVVQALGGRAFWPIMTMAGLLLVIFFFWLTVAESLYDAQFPDAPPPGVAAFIHQILTTPRGWRLILIGNAVGFVFALLVLSISVVSFPLLLDRDVGATAAMVTSIRAVAANPGPMAAWGLIVALALLIGSAPLLLGLIFVVPVLGHATWHLYRKVVV